MATVTTGFELIRFWGGWSVKKREKIYHFGMESNDSSEKLLNALWHLIDLLAWELISVDSRNYLCDTILQSHWLMWFVSKFDQLAVRFLSRSRNFLLCAEWIATVKCWFNFTTELFRSHFNLWPSNLNVSCLCDWWKSILWRWNQNVRWTSEIRSIWLYRLFFI